MTRHGLALLCASLLGCGEVYDAQGTLAVAGALPVPLASASSELTLTRTGPDLAADTVELRVEDETAGLSAAVAGPWTNTLEVAFLSGAAVSTPFYFRGDRSGVIALTLTSQRLGRRAANIEISSLLLTEDFEGGDFSIRDLKKWDDPVVQVPSKVSLAVEARGAHRGDLGLLVDDRDSNEGVAAEAEVARLTAVFRPFEGDQFLRAWVKVSPTSTVGDALPISVWRTGGAAIYDLSVRLPEGTVHPAGYDFNGIYVRDEPSPPLADGRWHLWEVAVLRMGTASTERAFWVDGRLVSKRTGMQTTGMRFTGDNFGEPWTGDSRFTGVLAFDDVRAGVTPHASQLVVSAGARAGACQEVTVTLQDSISAAASPAPYDVALELSGADGLYSDRGCTKSTQSVAIARGAASVRFFARAQRISVRHPDFLPPPELELSSGAGGCTVVPVGTLSCALLVLAARRRARTVHTS